MAIHRLLRVVSGTRMGGCLADRTAAGAPADHRGPGPGPVPIRRTSSSPGPRGWLPILLLIAGAAGCRGELDDPPMAIGAITEIASPAGAGSAEPNLAVGADGSVYLTWQEPTAEGHELRLASLEEDGWSPPATIARGNDWFINWADFPTLLVLPDGRLAAHYLQVHPRAERGYHYDVRLVLSDDGGRSWSDPVTPHRDGVATEHGFVSMIPAGGDSIGVIWLDGRAFSPEFGATDQMALLYTTVASDGSLGPERVIDGRTCECCQTSAAIVAGGAVVAYRGRTPGEIRDIQLARMAGGAWAPARPVHADGWEIAACPVNGPAVASDGADRLAVAWFTGARDTARVQVAFSDDAGDTFTTPVVVDEGNPAGRVDLVMLAGGDAVVSWIERTEGDGARVQLRHVTRDGRTSAPAIVAPTSGTRASGFPRMVRSGDGLLLTWTEPGSPSRVRTARAGLDGG
jgi:hypothetical protein